MIEAIELLRPWIRRQFGETVPNVAERLEAFRAIVPGSLPDDYAETLLWLKRATGLKSNSIDSIELPRPQEPGIFEYIGPNPPIYTIYGLQSGNSNLFEKLNGIGRRLPPSLIPIATDLGNQICLDVSEKGNGHVYHWFTVGDSGSDDAEGRPGWDNTFLLADSFTDLCRRLRPAPELSNTSPLGTICYVRK